MSWVLLTLLAVNLWAMANIIDKFVVSKHLKNPFILVSLGTVPTLIYTLILTSIFGLSIPNMFYGIAAFLLGVVLFGTFFLYYKALNYEEVSRIIPLYSISVIFTLVLATIFLGEIFTFGKYFGVALLILGSVLISYKHREKKNKFSKAFMLMTISSLIYAVFYVVSKYLSFNMDFMSIFILSELGIVACGMISFLAYRNEIRKIFVREKKIIFLRATTSLLGFSGFLFIFAAVSQGPASLVNALDLTQGLFVLIYATLVSIFAPKILKEEVKGSIIALKLISIIIIFVGGYLVSV